MRREKLAAAANAALADRERGTWGRDVGVIEIYVFARRKLPGARYALPVLSPLDSPPGVPVVLSLPALFLLPFLLILVSSASLFPYCPHIFSDFRCLCRHNIDCLPMSSTYDEPNFSHLNGGSDVGSSQERMQSQSWEPRCVVSLLHC